MICLIMDGFDVQAMGYVAPAVVAGLGRSRGRSSGPVFAAANFGVLIGSLVFSMVADKIGRRPVLIGATLFFSVMTIATAFAQNVQQLLWLRLIAGIGMGCIIPNATALVGEFSPKRSRVTFMMCITVGFTGRRGARRIRGPVDDPGLRLALGLHLRRRGSAGHRAAHDLGPPRVAAVPGRAAAAIATRWRTG